MSRFAWRLNGRQTSLLVLTLLLAGCAVMWEAYLFPAYGQWTIRKSQLADLTDEYARLNANLRASESVDREFQELGKDIEQTGSEQRVMSEFLRGLEGQARYPNLAIINIKPQPVEDGKTFKTYRVRLSLAGKLQDTLRFVAAVGDAGLNVGFDSFILRGAQGVNMVECDVTVRMIRIKTAAAPSAGGRGAKS